MLLQQRLKNGSERAKKVTILREHFNIFADEVMQSSNTAPTCSSLGPITDGKHSFTVGYRWHLGEIILPSHCFLFFIPLSSAHPHRNTHMHITMEMDGRGRGWDEAESFHIFSFLFITEPPGLTITSQPASV